MEIWKDIKGYEGKYQVSNLGRVKTLQRMAGIGKGYLRSEKIIKPEKITGGYLRVTLHDGSKYKRYRLHRLVLETFSPVGGMETLHANHNDENRENCSLDNLSWMTCRDNINYGTHNERMAKTKSKPVLCVELDKVFESALAAEKELGIHRQNISHVLRGKREIAGGYHWQYVK